MSTIINADIESMQLKDFTENAYLNYSMYVILDRALPNIADGLKPVQRRIVYAMSELGLKDTAKYKKSARTVGDVLGKYHPHGDSACYEAMVLMAQPFSYRYTLVDGQGNWGSPDDPKSFAAMRYTESKLSKYAQALLSELAQGTSDWAPNFDGTLEEPKLLPARLPNILLNGSTGIAVGMATDIPPHNLNEVVSACVHLLDNPDATIEKICEYVEGPDFPTEAEIISPRKDILEMYKKGGGSVRMRAVYQIEDGKIIITALPHQVSGAKVLEQIASQMRNKKLPMVEDLRDESDHENPTRLVIIPHSNRIDKDALIAHLFATTDLEKSYRINFNMIGLNGKPQVKNLKVILTEWLEYRRKTVIRRLEFRLNKVLDRLHILDAMLIAYLNIDEVIHIIRTSDEPKKALIDRFNLSERQAEAILEIKLRQLAKLEKIKIEQEQEALAKERDYVQDILGSAEKLRCLIREELVGDAKTFGDKRRSVIVEREEAKAIREEEMIPSEAVTVVLSSKGWIRAAKGHDIDPSLLSYRAGDEMLSFAKGRSNQNVVILDSTGRTYTLPIHTLPSAKGQGEPVSGKTSPPTGATFCSMIIGQPDSWVLLAAESGYGFIAKLDDLVTKNKAGKVSIKLPSYAKPLKMTFVNNLENDWLVAVTNIGRLLAFPVQLLPILPRGKGNKIIQIPQKKIANHEEYLIDVAVVTKTSVLKILSGKRNLSLTIKDLESYRGERGRRGNSLPRGFQKVDKLIVETY